MPIRVRDDDDDELDDDESAEAGFEAFDYEEENENLGPDERDRDLMDGTWEEKYYSGEARTRDWNALYLGIALLFLAAILVPAILVVTR